MASHNHSGNMYQPKWYIVLIILIVSLALVFPFSAKTVEVTEDAANMLFTGKILKILSEKDISEDDFAYAGATKEQELLVDVTINGEKKQITVVNNFSTASVGEEIMLQPAYGDSFIMMDFIRTKGIVGLTLFFIVLVCIVSGRKGVNALIALLFSFAVIISFIFPQIRSGYNPVMVGLVGAVLILTVTLYVSYGLNRKSISALLGIIGTLVFVSLLANFTVYALHFTGFSGEEAAFLKLEVNNKINMIGLVTAGIIIAAIGVLDDIAVTQASVVFELVATNPALTRWQLFRKAMVIGKDHISAVINTLVLAYTGASLPILLLFTLRPWPAEYSFSSERIAEEIVRTLVSSSGLVLAVPLTTLIAVALARRSYQKNRHAYVLTH